MLSQYKRLWIALAVVIAASFAVLGCFVLGLITGHSHDKRGRVEAGESEVRGVSGAHAHAGG